MSRCLVKFLTRKSRGGVNERESEVEGEPIRLGRGTDAEIFLADTRVSYDHARLFRRGDDVVIEAAGDQMIVVNGMPVRQATIAAKDDVDVGPYRLKLLETVEGYDLTISLELVKPVDDALARITATAKTSLADTMMSRRAVSWMLFAVIAVLFLAVPVVAFYTPGLNETQRETLGFSFEGSWNSGQISSVHGNIAEDCTLCHVEAFVMVQDDTCVACHVQTHAHVGIDEFPGDAFAELNDMRCASCHKEHNGHEGPSLAGSQWCADCHMDLDTRTAGMTDLWNVSGFSSDTHPQFAARVVQQPAWDDSETLFVSARIGAPDFPPEISNMDFPHDVHVDPNGSVGSVCADCHVLEDGGINFAEYNYEDHCSECHLLKFDAQYPQAEVPHGNYEAVLSQLRSFYAGKALAGEAEDQTAPSFARQRRRPGQPAPALTKSQQADMYAWAERRSLEAIEFVFGDEDRQLCRTCHVVDDPTVSASGDWEVRPVHQTTVWMPAAQFDHAAHETMACADCHDAANSARSTDVLLPPLENCTECHLDDEAAEHVAAVPSPCVSCHVNFHDPTRPLMESAAKAWATHPDNVAPAMPVVFEVELEQQGRTGTPAP